MQSPRQSRVRSWWPIGFLVGVSGVAWVAVLWLERSFYLPSDNLMQAYPWYQKLATSLHQGYLPLWDAGTFGGHSLAGDLVVGMFYPLNLLFVWLFGSAEGIGLPALELLVIVHFFIASLGMYLLAKRWRLSIPASLSAGLLYAFSGAVLMRASAQTCIFFGLALFPLAVYFFDRYLERRRIRELVFAALVFGNIILAGHLQPLIHGFVILGLYALLVGVPARGGRLKEYGMRSAAIVGIGIGSLAVAAPQVFLTAYYMPEALRWVYDGFVPLGGKDSYQTFSGQFLIPPLEFLGNLLDPVRTVIDDANYVFLGIPPLVILGLGVFRRKARQAVPAWPKHKWFLLAVLGFGVVTVVGDLTFFPHLLYEAPILNQVRELGRYAILIHFAFSLLLGIAIDAILARQWKQRVRWFRGAGALLAVSGLVILIAEPRVDWPYGMQFLIAGGVVAAVSVHSLRKRLGWLLLAAVTLTALLNVAWLTPRYADIPGPQQVYADNAVTKFLESQPYGEYRVMIQNDRLPVNSGDIYRFQTLGGYGPTLPTGFADYLKHDRTTLRLDPEHDAPELDALGVKYIVTRRSLPLREALYDPQSDLRVYEREHAFPKLFLPADLENRTGTSSVKFTTETYGDLTQRYRVELPQEERVILTELYDSGWTAEIDGQPVDLEAFNDTDPVVLSSLVVPAGSHEVTLRYEPFRLR